MSVLLENIGLIILKILAWIGELSSALLTNPIFIILMAIIILKILYKLILNIIDKREIKKIPYFSLDDGYQDWKNNYSQNARDMEEEEENDFLDSIM